MVVSYKPVLKVCKILNLSIKYKSLVIIKTLDFFIFLFRNHYYKIFCFRCVEIYSFKQNFLRREKLCFLNVKKCFFILDEVLLNLSKTKTKLTGKEQAKINNRKKFYIKFERICQKMIKDSETDQLISLRMNKTFIFPEYDELSILLSNSVIKPESELNFDESTPIDFPFYDEAHFLVKASRLKIIKIFRKETFVDDEGNERKGSAGSTDTYNYQSAYNWGLKIENIPKLTELLSKELESPTTYIIKPKMKKMEKMTYRKAWKPPRRRRR